MSRVMLHRRYLMSIAALSFAGLGVPGLHAQGKPEKPKLVLAIGGKSAVQYLPLVIAERLGFFAAEGLDVELQDLGGGSRAAQVVWDGSADVAGGAFEDIIHLQAHNQFFRAFVLLGRSPQVALGVSTRTMSSYKALTDLRGRKIGVALAGSSAGTVTSLVLARAGITPQEVSFVEVGSVAAALGAVRTSQVDAMAHTEPVMTMLEHKGDVRIISDTRTLKGTQDIFGGLMPCACLYATADYMQKAPNTVQALTHAVVRALKWLQTAGPTDLIKAVPDTYLMGDRGVYLAALGKVRDTVAPDGLIPDEGVRTAMRVVAQVDPTLNAGKIDLRRTFTNDFARKSKERFRA